jgi:serine/threonine-protein kinase RsbW
VDEGYEPQAGSMGPPPGAPVKRLDFTLTDLPRVRHFAASEARAAGMSEEAVGDFVIAVNEVATNAVTHGTTDARMRIWAENDDLIVEVHDEGTWKPGPMPGSVGGMGLWVVRLLTADLSLQVGGVGSTVTMRFTGKA